MGRRLLWQIYAPVLVVVLASLLAVTLYNTRSLRSSYMETTRADLAAKTLLVRDILAATPHEQLQRTAERLAVQSRARITVIAEDGSVVADSSSDPGEMDNHAGRPEIAAALGGRAGQSERESATVSQRMIYRAIPSKNPDGTKQVIRTAVPLTAVDRALRTAYLRIAAGAFLVAIAAAIAALFISRRISRPLEELEHGAARFARGELSTPLPVHGPTEIAGLAEAMNEMAAELDKRIRTVVEQRNEQDAVLAAMSEGVLAIDDDQRVITINRAAARLLGVDRNAASGRPLREAVRNAELQRFVARTLASTQPLQDELRFHFERERVWEAHGTRIQAVEAGRSGVVVVLNDVTEIRRLERTRTDFVANVSHELRTPITSVKGFLETLRDGALNDPEAAPRFVEIAARQADRLSAIIDDLLALSRLEGGDTTAIERSPTALADVVAGAVEACRSSAEASGVGLETSCDSDIEVFVNAALVEQALVNLIDNAVKYSPPDTSVEVRAEALDGHASVHVRDRGPGIERRHHERLFERFYRVDKARSRELGGTGLGLAIVKHIAQVHGGSVSVASEPGHGSTFTITLPLQV